MAAFIPFIFFFAFALMFRIVISTVGNHRRRSFEEIMNEERIANFSRKKEIPKESFCTPNIDALPIKEYPEDDDTFVAVRSTQEEVLKKANKKMILLTQPLTNIDIKKIYGYVNLDFIIEYEENYYSYINSLNMFAQSLINLKDLDSAKKVLEHAIVNMESNIFKTYNLICEVYEDTNDKEKLTEILSYIDTIESLKYNEELKDKIKLRFKKSINML